MKNEKNKATIKAKPDLIIDGVLIKKPDDLYLLYNDYFGSLMDKATDAGEKYDANAKPARTVEIIRDFYQEFFNGIPHKTYKTAEAFEKVCRRKLSCLFQQNWVFGANSAC